MIYIIEFGCGCGENTMAIEASSYDAAVDFAYQSAIEDYETFEGYHGIPDIEMVCEEYNIEDPLSEDAWIAYTETRESWLDYSVIDYNPDDEYHQDLVKEGVYTI